MLTNISINLFIIIAILLNFNYAANAKNIPDNTDTLLDTPTISAEPSQLPIMGDLPEEEINIMPIVPDMESLDDEELSNMLNDSLDEPESIMPMESMDTTPVPAAPSATDLAEDQLLDDLDQPVVEQPKPIKNFNKLKFFKKNSSELPSESNQ
jgi:hypothetical protein